MIKGTTRETPPKEDGSSSCCLTEAAAEELVTDGSKPVFNYLLHRTSGSLWERINNCRRKSSASSSRTDDAPVTTRTSYGSRHSPNSPGPFAASDSLRLALLPAATSGILDSVHREGQQGSVLHENPFWCSHSRLLADLPLIPFGSAHSLPHATGCSSGEEEDNRLCSGSKLVAVPKRAESAPLRRSCSSGAAPDHVSGSRHVECFFTGIAQGKRPFRVGLCCSSVRGECLLDDKTCSSHPALARSSSKISSSERSAVSWMPQKLLNFPSLTSRSLWNTRISACRPGLVALANHSSTGSSTRCAMTVQPSAPGAPTGVRAAAHSAIPARGCQTVSRSSCESSSRSISSNSSRCSNNSTWEAGCEHILTREDSGKAAGEEELDGAILRLQSLQLQHQPNSPLLLLRCGIRHETDFLQRIGGDTCPLAPELLTPAENTVSEQSASCASLQTPASAASCYGFTWAAEVGARVAAYEKKTAGQRRKQTRQWEAYLASNPSFEDKKALKRLVRKGIPDRLRGKVWASFLGADALLSSDPEAFERLQSEELPRDVSGQIELDLPRTFPNNRRFRCSSGIGALRRVLRGFAAARPAVGYCQGLNFLAATLLLFQKQDLALASLLQLVESKDKTKGLQIGRYYSSGMVDLRRDLKVFELLIRRKSPRVFQLLRRTGIEVEWLAAEWFLCLFCTSCPEPTVLRIWDCLMLEGPKILFRVALGIIFYFESELIKMQSLEQVMGLLKAKLALLVEHNELLRLCFHKLRSFPRRKLQALQHTVAAGLVDPCRSVQQHGHQEQQRQPPSRFPRRLRMLSFGRLGNGQTSPSELAIQHAPQRQCKWRQRFSKVNIGLRRKDCAPVRGESPSFCLGNSTPVMGCMDSVQGYANLPRRSAEIARPSATGVKDHQQSQQRP